MTQQLSLNLPKILAGNVEISEIYQNYNASGNPTSYGVDLELPELMLHRQVKSKDFHLLQPKIESTLDSWGKKYERHIDTEHKRARAQSVSELDDEASEQLVSLHTLLEHTLSVNDAVDWDSLKRKDSYRAGSPQGKAAPTNPEQLMFNSYGRPTGIIQVEVPDEPCLDGVRAGYGFFSRFFRSSKIEADLAGQMIAWKKVKSDAEAENSRRETLLHRATGEFEIAKASFDQQKARDNEAIDALRSRYADLDSDAVEEYCEIVLGASQYPDYFPQSWVLEYRPDARMVVVDYDLPAPNQLPSVESYRYVKARDEISEKRLSAAAQKKLYESTIYQVCIRTIHELFEADSANALDAVVFNGCVSDISPATGVMNDKMILSVLAGKSDFEEFDLAHVDPKATFKHLKGVAATALVDLAPIPPVVTIDRSDKRFIDGKAVTWTLDDSVNIAAMDWEDFEHLIRELFEQEFAVGGGEVRVTQASSDGGVDAVAFDPDPIRGGKIVIQAKRYTNTVGVAAVRDLYGTVMNEGATKGIIVTTSDYGRDSYEFAKDKPLTLLNGSNLLALLEKHGHRARINVDEAKAALKEI